MKHFALLKFLFSAALFIVLVERASNQEYMGTLVFILLLLFDLFQCYVGYCLYLFEKRQTNFDAVPNRTPEVSVRRELPIVLDRLHPLRVT